MRIGRFEAEGKACIGVFADDHVRDVTNEFEDFQDILSRPHDAEEVDGKTFDRDEITFKPPTTDRNTVFCAALNYEAHAEESNIDVPERPLVFMKLARTLVGHREPISYHTRVTEEIDYEAELAAVIGTPARYVSPEEALDYVAGYTILNDTSARDLQLSLQVGDIVATGTPEGVGAFQDIKLELGETVEVEIEDMGTLINTVGEADD